jgi:hypothetical protein
MVIMNGAGDGNRTHVCSLEGCRSTIELHPHLTAAVERIIPPSLRMSIRRISKYLIAPSNQPWGNSVPNFIL